MSPPRLHLIILSYHSPLLRCRDMSTFLPLRQLFITIPSWLYDDVSMLVPHYLRFITFLSSISALFLSTLPPLYLRAINPLSFPSHVFHSQDFSPHHIEKRQATIATTVTVTVTAPTIFVTQTASITRTILGPAFAIVTIRVHNYTMTAFIPVMSITTTITPTRTMTIFRSTTTRVVPSTRSRCHHHQPRDFLHAHDVPHHWDGHGQHLPAAVAWTAPTPPGPGLQPGPRPGPGPAPHPQPSPRPPPSPPPSSLPPLSPTPPPPPRSPHLESILPSFMPIFPPPPLPGPRPRPKSVTPGSSGPQPSFAPILP
ncbi:hypothetical protein M422DRAFT_263675 [Sphaerobolus stellatus SS14]|uniref:Uncharacterized protein n=1 Tax=Sphaerobolus stellatus (strain SS14) TaxID=990650 RepID=A0A0C9VA28_SPHS4|nr:hypothetical protein M422DRAFT_263675 [Sphaerobolus stellatus SS14]